MKATHDSEPFTQRRLTALEREIITVAQLRAGANVTTLAKLCKRPAHQVRYVLTKLSDEGIIRPLVSLNLHALGWVYASVHFTSLSSRLLNPQEVIRKLKNTRQITYVSCFSTEPQYEVSFAVDSIHSVQPYIEELSETLSIAEKTIAIRLESVLSGRKYLSKNQHPGMPLVSRKTEDIFQIDSVDRKLLHLLVTEPRLSIRRLAGLAGLPETSARLRIRKLEEKKIISGFRYHFQNDRFSVLDFKILIYTTMSSRKFRKEFESFVDGHPNVIHRSTCLAPWDFELEVEVEAPNQAAALCHEIRAKFPKEVRSIHSLPRFFSQSFLNRMFA